MHCFLINKIDFDVTQTSMWSTLAISFDAQQGFRGRCWKKGYALTYIDIHWQAQSSV